MINRITIASLVTAVLFITGLIASPVFADETMKKILAGKYNEDKDICIVVKKSITGGLNTKDVTKTAIQMGHDACLVIRCGIEAEGNLEQIITGALEAGTTSDVCSRCAIEAGADPAALAKIFETGRGPAPALAGKLTPIEIGYPGGERGGGFLSPSVP
jgi:hypothetical protein